MKKLSMPIITVLVLLCGHFALAQTQTKELVLQNFEAVSVGGAFNVVLKASDEEKVTLKASEKLLERVEAEVKEGVLKIRMKNSNWNWSWNENEVVEVTVSFKKLNKISASASADIRSVSKISAEKLVLSVSSGADMDLEVEAGSLSCDVSSGADARLVGSANTFDAEASSGASINAYDVKVEKCVARASSGADIKLQVVQELEANASSGGDVKYKGNPPLLRIKSSSGGDVTAKN